MSAAPLPMVGLGRAVPAIPTPTGPLLHEARELARLSGNDEMAAALVRQLGRLVVCVPAMTLLALLDRWASRLEDLSKSLEGAMLAIRHRVSRGKHSELWIATKERIG